MSISLSRVAQRAAFGARSFSVAAQQPRWAPQARPFFPQQQQFAIARRNFSSQMVATIRPLSENTPADEPVNVIPMTSKASSTMQEHAWSGCLALPQDSEGRVPEDAGKQLELAFANAFRYLEQNRSSSKQVFRVDVVYKDQADLPVLMEAYQRVFPEDGPFKQFIPARPLDFEGGDWKCAVTVLGNKSYAWVLPAVALAGINIVLWTIVLS